MHNLSESQLCIFLTYFCQYLFTDVSQILLSLTLDEIWRNFKVVALDFHQFNKVCSLAECTTNPPLHVLFPDQDTGRVPSATFILSVSIRENFH